MMMFLRIMFYPIWLLLLVLTCIEFFPVVAESFKNILSYQWLLYGMAAYFIIRRFKFFARNEMWLQTTSHETTHALVGMMFFHKIHSLQANEDNGVVYHSGQKFGDLFISLSPYCFPVLTYVLLFMRIMCANKMLYVFDILIGFTLAFYIVCFCKQTGLYQTDIQKQGYVRSFIFLFTAWFFNATIILLSIKRGIIGAIKYIFPEYWGNLVDWWNFIF